MQLIGKRTVLQQKERVELKHLFLIFPLARFLFFFFFAYYIFYLYLHLSHFQIKLLRVRCKRLKQLCLLHFICSGFRTKAF